MSNSILDLVNSQKSNQPMPQVQRVKNLMAQIKNSQNPQYALQNIISQSPELSNVYNILRMSNFTPQQFAQMLAQQKGVDLNSLIQ